MKINNKGFTLVELAIVIVIIGLLVGGVLQGQELIKQAQIRSALSAVQGYNAAINTFRAKYNEMPGDIARASQFAINCPKGVTCSGSADNVCGTTATNGNGNGILESGNDATCSTSAANGTYATFTGEIANFWAHLGNTQLVKGNYPFSESATGVVGTNFPSLPIGTGIVAASDGGLLYWVTGIPGSPNAFGASPSTATSIVPLSANRTMTPSEAYGLDSKLDDGRPLLGSIQTVNLYNAGAFTVSTTADVTCGTATGDYNLGTNADAKACTIRIRADG
jgi:prepilin-type N-terminal cleavage/methylation domain-containing protein